MSPVAQRPREVVRTPSGEVVSVPVVRRRGWIALLVLVLAVVAVIAVLLITHQPPGRSVNPNAQPSGFAQPAAPGQQQQP